MTTAERKGFALAEQADCILESGILSLVVVLSADVFNFGLIRLI